MSAPINVRLAARLWVEQGDYGSAMQFLAENGMSESERAQFLVDEGESFTFALLHANDRVCEWTCHDECSTANERNHGEAAPCSFHHITRDGARIETAEDHGPGCDGPWNCTCPPRPQFENRDAVYFPRYEPRPPVSDFVSIEALDGSSGWALQVWDVDGNPTTIARFHGRKLADEARDKLRDALKTWGGWDDAVN